MNQEGLSYEELTLYSRTQVRRVRCPACGADPGERCIGERDKSRAMNHMERVQAHLEVMRELGEYE